MPSAALREPGRRMNNDFYGLREQPFLMAPSPRLYYASTVHRRAFAHLTYGLAQREGFVVVTGEVGAGKTTLIERLCGELDDRGFSIARIATTLVSSEDMLRMVAAAFGAESEGSKATVLRSLTAVLRDPARRHLLIVDEAQGLSVAALEELRMLSNVTLPDQPALQTILVGQPQLGRIMASPDLDQLRQRVLASFHIAALEPADTHAYVMHRLRYAGWQHGRPDWDHAALDEVHAHSGGLPRRINRLCSRVLLAGSLEESSLITAAMVEETALELEGDLAGPGQSGSMPTPARAPAVRAAPVVVPPSWMNNDMEMQAEPPPPPPPPRRRSWIQRLFYPYSVAR